MAYYPQFPQASFQPQPQFQQNQIQSNGFISVPSEEIARNYPVAPGISVSFKNENAPYVYTKTMGFSQFDQPIFKKYKLIEEETEHTPEVSRSGIDIQDEISKIWGEINALKRSYKKDTTRDKSSEDRRDEQHK